MAIPARLEDELQNFKTMVIGEEGNESAECIGERSMVVENIVDFEAEVDGVHYLLGMMFVMLIV